MLFTVSNPVTSLQIFFTFFIAAEVTTGGALLPVMAFHDRLTPIEYYKVST
jgi:hypothetical protein